MTQPTMPAWPASLPQPTADGYSIDRLDAMERMETESGLPRARPRWRSAPSKLTISWTMTQAQYDVFDGFFKSTLGGGASPFTMSLMGFDAVPKTMYAQFTQVYSASKQDNGAFRVSGELLVTSSVWVIENLPRITPQAPAVPLDTTLTSELALFGLTGLSVKRIAARVLATTGQITGAIDISRVLNQIWWSNPTGTQLLKHVGASTEVVGETSYPNYVNVNGKVTAPWFRDVAGGFVPVIRAEGTRLLSISADINDLTGYQGAIVATDGDGRVAIANVKNSLNPLITDLRLFSKDPYQVYVGNQTDLIELPQGRNIQGETVFCVFVDKHCAYTLYKRNADGRLCVARHLFPTVGIGAPAQGYKDEVELQLPANTDSQAQTSGLASIAMYVDADGVVWVLAQTAIGGASKLYRCAASQGERAFSVFAEIQNVSLPTSHQSMYVGKRVLAFWGTDGLYAAGL